MWILTRDGFVSVVQETEGEHKGDLVVRARERGALEALRRHAPTLSEIVIRPDRDYRYRAWLKRESLAAALAAMALEIDYPNFKAEAERVNGRRSRYVDALHDLWWRLGRLQPGGPYGTGGRDYPPVPKGER